MWEIDFFFFAGIYEYGLARIGSNDARQCFDCDHSNQSIKEILDVHDMLAFADVLLLNTADWVNCAQKNNCGFVSA